MVLQFCRRFLPHCGFIVCLRYIIKLKHPLQDIIAPLKRASHMRMILRAILRALRLRRADGDQFTAIARVLAAPHAAIAIVRALLARCFNRRRAVAVPMAPVASLGEAPHAPLACADTS